MCSYSRQIFEIISIFLVMSFSGCHQKTLQKEDSNRVLTASDGLIERCKIACDPMNPTYQCLILGTLGKDRNAQIGNFIDRLSQGQNVTVPHAELLKIFGITDAGYSDARGDTRIDTTRLYNSGHPSVITAATTSGLDFRLEVPKEVSYKHSDFGPNSFVLHSESQQQSFYIAIGDSVLNRTYGGQVREMLVSKSASIFATESGCIAYDPTPDFLYTRAAKSLMQITRDRLARDEARGASKAELQAVKAAYSRITPLQSDQCIPEKEQCQECDLPSQVPCNTDLGTICMDSAACLKKGYRICGT
jgi:hypothetical protein